MKMGIRSLAAALLFFVVSGPVLAAGMSCYVDTHAYDRFTPNNCLSMIWGANSATAVFRIDDEPANRYIDWQTPDCPSNSNVCTTTIYAFSPFQAHATVINLDTGEVTKVSATARFEDGR